MKRLLRFSLSSLCIIAFIICGCAGTFGEASALKDLANARWLILGPFPNPVAKGCPGFDRDFLTEIGGEASARPRRGLSTAGEKWSEVTANEGRVDLLTQMTESSDVVAYAYTEWDSKTDGPAVLKLGSDDGVRVWCNGNLAWANHVHRGMRRDEDAVRLSLRKGRNSILIKVDQGTGSWEFTARLVSIEEEQRAWQTVENPGLRIVLSRQTFDRPQEAACVVITQPAYAVSEKIELFVTDGKGRETGTRQCVTGELTALPLPRDARGIFFIRVKGMGGRTGSAEAMTPLLVGDRKRITAEAVARARSARPSDEMAEASLAFFVEELEDRLPPALCTPERNIRAAAAITRICSLLDDGTWRPDVLRGLNQWAYRSEIDGSLQPYSLYLPPAYTQGKRCALVVALHGYTGNDYDSAALLTQTCPDDFIVAAPYGRGDIGYHTIGEQDVLDVMERVQKLYSVDPDRIYLMGWSMGGMGTWRIGQSFTDRFAAIATFCGWTGTEALENLGNTPMLVVHGDADTTVPFSMDRAATERLRALGCPVEYQQLSGVNHDAWGAWTADGRNNVFDFFTRHRRDPWPQRVRFSVEYLGYGRHFWTRVDELAEPPKPGRLEAEVMDDRTVRVSETGVAAFALDLRHPRLAQSGDIVVAVDGTRLTLGAGQEGAVLARDNEGNWRVGSKTAPGVARHAGGGLFDLFTGPLLIIYGTGRKDTVDDLKRAALAMADWSPRGMGVGSTLGAFRVVSDADVTESDLSRGNVLLIGNTEENRFVARQLEMMHVERDKDSVAMDGSRVTGSGLLAVFTNTRAPRYLAGVILFPEGVHGMEGALARYLKAGHIFNVSTAATAAVLAPDVVVFPDASALLSAARSWRGFWDREWKGVRRVP